MKLHASFGWGNIKTYHMMSTSCNNVAVCGERSECKIMENYIIAARCLQDIINLILKCTQMHSDCSTLRVPKVAIIGNEIA